MSNIHPTAIVDETVRIGDDVTVGPFSIVRANAVIGDRCQIHANALIGENTTLHSGCKVFHGAVVGEIPQDLKYHSEETYTEIGENTVIREYATIHRGTEDRVTTSVGNNCLVMAYVHIAHDCQVGDHVILANAVNLAGHVTIDDYASLGGLVPVHQFVRIGAHAYIGGGFRVSKDVPPFILASKQPLTYGGLNVVGLRRRGFSSESRNIIKKAYRILFRSEYNTSQAVEKIREELPDTEEIRRILTFIKESRRGLIG